MNAKTKLRAPGAVVAGASLALVAAACGSSSHTSAPTTVGAAAPASAAAYTVRAASVGQFGKLLVNGQGRTLYLLSSEAGGKVTCVDATGCTTVWPPVELPSGVSAPVAGSGVDGAKLGTVTSATGDHYVTYGGWPLYEFSGDHGTGTASGQGISSFGGTWSAVTVSGAPVSSPTTAHSSGGGYGGY